MHLKYPLYYILIQEADTNFDIRLTLASASQNDINPAKDDWKKTPACCGNKFSLNYTNCLGIIYVYQCDNTQNNFHKWNLMSL